MLVCNFQGYDKYLRRIFAKAGYCLSEEKRKALSEQAVEKELKQEKEEIGQFDNLYKCTEVSQLLIAIGQDKLNNVAGLQIRVHIGKLFSLFLIQNICFGDSKEPSH